MSASWREQSAAVNSDGVSTVLGNLEARALQSSTSCTPSDGSAETHVVSETAAPCEARVHGVTQEGHDHWEENTAEAYSPCSFEFVRSRCEAAAQTWMPYHEWATQRRPFKLPPGLPRAPRQADMESLLSPEASLGVGCTTIGCSDDDLDEEWDAWFSRNVENGNFSASWLGTTTPKTTSPSTDAACIPAGAPLTDKDESSSDASSEGDAEDDCVPVTAPSSPPRAAAVTAVAVPTGMTSAFAQGCPRSCFADAAPLSPPSYSRFAVALVHSSAAASDDDGSSSEPSSPLSPADSDCRTDMEECSRYSSSRSSSSSSLTTMGSGGCCCGDDAMQEGGEDAENLFGSGPGAMDAGEDPVCGYLSACCSSGSGSDAAAQAAVAPSLLPTVTRCAAASAPVEVMDCGDWERQVEVKLTCAAPAFVGAFASEALCPPWLAPRLERMLLEVVVEALWGPDAC
ncbi:hypothetical protein Agub_g11310 [Astrephomene gubernaculifera]|uniref:Uncharacterized protein n=1 Tax=Astrephomene gubernaculifera TaxID=47775 RepID=A0AAD3DWR3_9CHLO|nr:hypothetical protein Agub_g11310 [Astrephomene gubernaculifera]